MCARKVEKAKVITGVKIERCVCTEGVMVRGAGRGGESQDLQL